MKTSHFFVFLAVWLAAAPMRATVADKPLRYAMAYEKHDFLRSHGRALHFVNVDVEWPLWIGMDQQPLLQQHLCKMLFNKEAGGFEEALTAYLEHLGTPLTELPSDDSLYTRYYHALEVRVVDYSPGRYISFRTVALHRAGTDIEWERTSHHIFSYDLKNKRVLEPRDLLANACFYESFKRDYMYNVVANCTSDEDWDIFEKAELPKDVCLLQEGLVFDLGRGYFGNPYHALTFVNSRLAEPFLLKKVKKLLSLIPSETEKPGLDSFVWPSASEQVDTTKVYDAAEEPPSFMGGNKALMNFLSNNLAYPKLDQTFGKEGKVVVQFVVERDGTITSPIVIKSVSPGLDREAVKVVRMMPKWTPGTINGITVRTKYSLPFNYKITE